MAKIHKVRKISAVLDSVPRVPGPHHIRLIVEGLSHEKHAIKAMKAITKDRINTRLTRQQMSFAAKKVVSYLCTPENSALQEAAFRALPHVKSHIFDGHIERIVNATKGKVRFRKGPLLASIDLIDDLSKSQKEQVAASTFGMMFHRTDYFRHDFEGIVDEVFPFFAEYLGEEQHDRLIQHLGGTSSALRDLAIVASPIVYPNMNPEQKKQVKYMLEAYTMDKDPELQTLAKVAFPLILPEEKK